MEWEIDEWAWRDGMVISRDSNTYREMNWDIYYTTDTRYQISNRPRSVYHSTLPYPPLPFFDTAPKIPGCGREILILNTDDPGVITWKLRGRQPPISLSTYSNRIVISIPTFINLVNLPTYQPTTQPPPPCPSLLPLPSNTPCY